MLSLLTHCLYDIKKWMSQNFLQRNSNKTELLVIGSQQSFLPALLLACAMWTLLCSAMCRCFLRLTYHVLCELLVEQVCVFVVMWLKQEETQKHTRLICLADWIPLVTNALPARHQTSLIKFWCDPRISIFSQWLLSLLSPECCLAKLAPCLVLIG